MCGYRVRRLPRIDGPRQSPPPQRRMPPRRGAIEPRRSSVTRDRRDEYAPYGLADMAGNAGAGLASDNRSGGAYAQSQAHSANCTRVARAGGRPVVQLLERSQGAALASNSLCCRGTPDRLTRASGALGSPWRSSRPGCASAPTVGSNPERSGCQYAVDRP